MNTKFSPQEEIKKALLNGEKLTVQMAFRRFHTTELRRCISRLIHEQGMNIKSIPVKGETYNEYFLAN